jgi:DNA repair protein RecO (recombination protein O)
MMPSGARERLYRTEAVVLRRHDFGEADRMLTLYTPGLGKIRVLAKGVRKPRSRKAGHVELFTHNRLLIAKGRSLDIVTQADTINTFLALRTELSRTSCGYYVAELVDKFTEEREENGRVFDLLVQTLAWLGEAEDTDLVLRYFELRLLDYVGYRPQLLQCVSCKRSVGSTAARFSPAQGGILCRECARVERGGRDVPAPVLGTLRHLQTKGYSQCRGLSVNEQAHYELQNTMRQYIIYLLERGLKSADFLDTLRREDGLGAPALERG